jgi:hypothetical protein
MKIRPALCASLAALTLAAACDSGSPDPSPTSPAFSSGASATDGAWKGDKGTPTVTVKGTVSALSGACPTVAFTVSGKTIKTSAATGYGDRGCADVKNDVKADVAGTAQADGSILAVQLRIAPPPAPVPAITGAITALAGTCPALTITVGTKSATTTSATTFSGKPCADLKTGTEVAIFGAVPGGGSTLVATMVMSRK